MYDSTYLTRVVDQSTVYFYQHYNHINYTGAAVVLLACAVLGGFLTHRMKKGGDV